MPKKKKTIKGYAIINKETDIIEEGDYFADLECPYSSGSGTLAVYENERTARAYTYRSGKRPAFKVVPCTITLNPPRKTAK